MKSKWQNLRDLTGVSLVALAALLGIYGMLNAELLVDPAKYDPTTQFATIRQGLQQYCSAFGLILLFAGIAYILTGHNDRVETRPSALTPEDED